MLFSDGFEPRPSSPFLENWSFCEVKSRGLGSSSTFKARDQLGLNLLGLDPSLNCYYIDVVKENKRFSSNFVSIHCVENSKGIVFFILLLNHEIAGVGGLF